MLLFSLFLLLLLSLLFILDFLLGLVLGFEFGLLLPFGSLSLGGVGIEFSFFRHGGNDHVFGGLLDLDLLLKVLFGLFLNFNKAIMVLLDLALFLVELRFVLVKSLFSLSEFGVHVLLFLFQVRVLVVQLVCLLKCLLLKFLLSVR